MRIKLIQSNRTAKPQYAIVDPEDYWKLSQYNWLLYESLSKKCYAVSLQGKKNVYMHRVIMDAPAGKLVDHRDRDGLNNTRENLRFATPAQNCFNRVWSKKSSSKYRGVSFKKKDRKWQASITYNGITKYLGSFKIEEDAARAYDNAAKIHHGEFAVLNFPPVANKY